MKIKALRNIRFFHNGKYHYIKKDDELPSGEIQLSEKEIKILSKNPAFKAKETKKKK
jgi:hypothetical protein